jgi:glyoxylase-like metal-dependent hydrolase (beta-lactamase superfamily II)
VAGGRYAEADQRLARLTILPYEGAGEGRVLYREAKLMLAVDALRNNKVSVALRAIAAAREWPERLGAGKPYPADIDERLEDWLEALARHRRQRSSLPEPAPPTGLVGTEAKVLRAWFSPAASPDHPLAQPTMTHSDAIEPGTLPPSWYAGGPACGGRPDFQVHAYNDDWYIFRQAACTNFEKPFLYLIFGQDRAILFDTGAGHANVRGAVDGVIQAWLTRHGRASIPLVVAHSHGHGDHIAGDEQFRDRPGTTIVAKEPEAVQAFFGMADWPNRAVTFDLGNRILDIIPIPGHQVAGIAVYDRRTAIMLTGDTFYPGRLYVRDGAAFTASIERLVDFTRDRPVAHFLGTHIENTREPFWDYPEGTVDQPNEHSLELGRAQLLEMADTLRPMAGHVTRRVLRDLTIWPVSP